MYMLVQYIVTIKCILSHVLNEPNGIVCVELGYVFVTGLYSITRTTIIHVIYMYMYM